MKKYGLVKVKDPSTDGHTVRLLPFQSFEITFTKRNPTDVFNLITIGEFLLLTETHETKESITFKIEQKYNMTGWAKLSTTFMGNIVIFKSMEGVSGELRLCVYCTPETPSKDNVVTVINPDGCLVKIEPHQVLHVVMYDKEPSKWSIDNPSSLNCVRCETVMNDFQSVYDPEALFCPEPRSNGLPMNERLKDHPPEFFSNEIMGGKGLTTEYHFWSCLTSSEIGKLNHSPNGSYDIGTVTMHGEFDGRESFRKMDVMLSVRGEKRKLNLEHFKAIYSIARCWNERSLSYVRHSIFNPRITEDLDVSESDGWFYVEIPSPQVYFPELKECQWTCDDLNGVTTIQCHELRSRYINGKEVQRFLISGIRSNKESNLMHIGMIGFSVTQDNVCHIMTLNFWKIPNLESVGSKELQPATRTVTRMSERIEVTLEVTDDKTFADDECIIPLSMIDASELEYENEYGYGCYFPRDYERMTKKKFPLIDSREGSLIPAFSIGNMCLLSARNIGS